MEAADDGELVFTDDLPERLAAVESGFGLRMQRAIDGYIAAASVEAPESLPAPADDWLPSEPARLNLAAENITSVCGPLADFWAVRGGASPPTLVCEL